MDGAPVENLARFMTYLTDFHNQYGYIAQQRCYTEKIETLSPFSRAWQVRGGEVT